MIDFRVIINAFIIQFIDLFDKLIMLDFTLFYGITLIIFKKNMNHL